MKTPPPLITDPRLKELAAGIGDIPAMLKAMAAIGTVFAATDADGAVQLPAEAIDTLSGLDGFSDTLVATGFLSEENGILRVIDSTIESLTPLQRKQIWRAEETSARSARREAAKAGKPAKKERTPTRKSKPKAFTNYGNLPFKISGAPVTLHSNSDNGTFFAQVRLADGDSISANVDDSRPGNWRGIANSLASRAWKLHKDRRRKRDPRGMNPAPQDFSASAALLPALVGAPEEGEWQRFAEAIQAGENPPDRTASEQETGLSGQKTGLSGFSQPEPISNLKIETENVRETREKPQK